MFEAKEISKFYGNQKVLDDLSLKIKEGEIASIVGSSGSGKTTLLRILSGLEIPETGEITFDNETIYSSKTFIPPEERNCSLVFQDYALFPNLSMLDNIYFGEGSKNNNEVISELIQITGIGKILNKFPHECSGGEQQRVALVRSMATKPKLILMDEPLSNLDFHLKSKISLIISEIIRRYNTTAVIVTHDIMDAMKISDKIIVIDKGKIIQIGAPLEIYEFPNSKKVARLFGDTNFVPLAIYPKSKHHIIYDKEEESLIHVRPNQFHIFNKETSRDKLVLEGQIKSLKNIAGKMHIILACEEINSDINLIIGINSDLKIGQNFKVMA